MATFFKRQTRKPIPDGAVIRTIRGKRVADWKDKQGRTRREPLADDGQAILVEAETWSALYFDENGIRRQVGTGITDKDGAKQYVAELVRTAKLRAVGLHDARAEKLADEARRPLDEHLNDFRAKMESAGRDGRHVADTIRYIEKIAEAAGFKTAADITDDAVHTFAAELAKNRSARTVGAHLTAIRAFSKWLADGNKLSHDPLRTVKKPSVQADRRRERRMLLHEEWPWLRSATLAGSEEREGMPAAERVLLYAVAIQTGLRLNELRSLTRRRLFLDNGQPFITCAARSTKNSKDCRQYIKRDLAEQLRQHIATKTPGAPVFAVPPKEDAAGMLRADLAAARAEWVKAAKDDPQEHLRREQSDFLLPVNHEGEHCDFHSLRHTCGAWLALSGAHPNVVKEIMRHSTITLTMDAYGHLFPGSEAAAIEKLPDMVSDKPEALKLAEVAG